VAGGATGGAGVVNRILVVKLLATGRIPGRNGFTDLRLVASIVFGPTTGGKPKEQKG
jgi:hypothetical protein